tara:strand:- start:106 stop:279 length:174 start_codon:yes stop_codon:yes gene_type:complete
MKKILIFTFLLLSSCAYDTNNKNSQSNINFSKNMSFKNFKLNLEKYAKESTYPNLDD